MSRFKSWRTRLAGVVGAWVLVGSVAACGSAIRALDSVNEPKDDSALAECRKEMRVARDAGADPDAAYHVYYDCTVEAGLR